MSPALTIGDFSRATHLNVKTLRYYHPPGQSPTLAGDLLAQESSAS